MTRDDVRVRRIDHLAIELATEHDASDVRFDALLGPGQRAGQMSDDEHGGSRPALTAISIPARNTAGELNRSACSSPTYRRAAYSSRPGPAGSRRRALLRLCLPADGQWPETISCLC